MSNGNSWFHNYRHYSSSDVEPIEFNKWQFVSYEIIPDGQNQQTKVNYVHNNEIVDDVVFDGYVAVSMDNSSVSFYENLCLGMAIRSPGMHFGTFNVLNTVIGNAQPPEDSVNPFGPDTVNYGEDFYRGWIHSVYFLNFPVIDYETFGFYLTSGCDDCSGYNVCSHTLNCFNDCNWNEFLNSESKCQRCPDWCHYGCHSPDASCNVPSSPDWLDRSL